MTARVYLTGEDPGLRLVHVSPSIMGLKGGAVSKLYLGTHGPGGGGTDDAVSIYPVRT